MKKLPNGDIAFYSYFAGSVWSLILGIALTLLTIFGYFAIPFQKDEGFIYIFMAAPIAVIAIMLFKTFFKPTAQILISHEGVRFLRHENISRKSIELNWEQIDAIYYNKEWASGHRRRYQADILLFKTKDNISYKFNLSFFKPEDIQKLYNIFEQHNFKITNPPIEKEDLKISKPWPTGKSNCVEKGNGIYLFFKKGRILNLIGAIVLSIVIILGYFSKSIDSIGWFFMTLPLWVFVMMLGKTFLKPVPIFAISPYDIFFSKRQSADIPTAIIKWVDILEIRKEVKNLGNIDGVQPTLVFTLKNGATHVASLKDIVKVDYDKIVSICAKHDIIVKE